MSKRALALIGYPAEYFLQSAQALEEANFDIYWVCALKSDTNFLARNGVAQSKILDLTSGFLPDQHSLAHCRESLLKYENDTDPKFNDIVLMDRLIRRKNWTFSIKYLHHIAVNIEKFLTSRKIDMLTSWRDNAVQLTAMLVARRLNIPLVVPTRIRIPQDVYGFCSAHHTLSFLPLRRPAANDFKWAHNFLDGFEKRLHVPGLKVSSRSISDAIRLVPMHSSAFYYELRRSVADMGNNYSRYTIPHLILKYIQRRLNLIFYKVFDPCDRNLIQYPNFCLYALHTQPESSIDVQGSFFSNQIELITHVARSLPSSHVLFVKVHPTDVDGKTLNFYKEIKRIPSVVLVHHSIDSQNLVRRADIIFALTGTIAYEAALLQKPVIVFAKNFFNNLPTVHLCQAPMALPSLVSNLIVKQSLPTDHRASIIAFLANLKACCFEGEVSRSWQALHKGLTADDLRQLQIAYNALHAFYFK